MTHLNVTQWDYLKKQKQQVKSHWKDGMQIKSINMTEKIDRLHLLFLMMTKYFLYKAKKKKKKKKKKQT